MSDLIYAAFADPTTALSLRDAPPISPGPGEVRAELLAAPINPSDLLQIAGLYGTRPPLPAIGGNEGLGRVVEVGEGTFLQVGQRVLLPVGAGTWRHSVTAKASTFIPVPADGDPLQMAMLAVNPPTAWLVLERFVDLNEGEWVIQSAANSAVGTYLVQLARRRGLKTVNIVRRESAVAGVKAAGGDVVLVDSPDLSERIKAATGKAKIRLAIDAVGGALSGRLAESLTRGGTIVAYGALSMQPFKISPNALIFSDVTLKGFWLAHWFRQTAPAEQARIYGKVGALVADGTLKTAIDSTYPLEDFTTAVERAAADGRNGKVLFVNS